jgi:hypothetical protein
MKVVLVNNVVAETALGVVDRDAFTATKFAAENRDLAPSLG